MRALKGQTSLGWGTDMLPGLKVEGSEGKLPSGCFLLRRAA